MSHNKSPFFELRSGLLDTLFFIPKVAELDAIQSELSRRFETTPEFFSGEVVVIDLRRLAPHDSVPLIDLIQLLERVRMKVVGVIAESAQRAWAAQAGLPFFDAHDKRMATTKSESSTCVEPAEAVVETIEPVVAAAQTLIIEKPLRSGQQVYASGDLVVLGLVSHGAEIIAEGNLYIYAPLRGRALAGVLGRRDARIFCTCLEPELISIAGIYRTTENPLPDDIIGKSAQIRLEAERLKIEPLRLA